MRVVDRMSVGFSLTLAALWMVGGAARAAEPAAEAQPLATLTPALPSVPDRSFTVTDYGTVGDGKTLDTAALQKAIDTCAAAGGGTVRVPAGTYLTAPLMLASNLNLHLDAGATILMSDDLHYYLSPLKGYHDFCILADNCHDVEITGSGTLDGQGEFWWTHYRRAPDWPDGPNGDPKMFRPFFVVFLRCERVLVDGITLQNSPSFHILPSACDNVTVRDIHTNSPARSPNTDGIDPSGTNYLITHCTFDGGDDCVALKSAALVDNGVCPTCENFLITDCTCLHGHGISIGSQVNGGVNHVLVRNCTFDGTQIGIRLKAHRDRGGLVHDVTYQDLSMKNVGMAVLITSYYPRIPPHPETDAAQPVTATTPEWRNIRFENITATDVKNAGRIIGVPEMPIKDVLFTNVHISATNGFQFINADGVRFVDSDIQASSGPSWTEINSEIDGLGPVPTTGEVKVGDSTSATPAK